MSDSFVVGTADFVPQMPPMRRVKFVHLIGIGGAGMCGIAEVLKHQGFIVSGSDLVSSSVTDRLKRLGINVQIGHRASQVCDADVVVVSTAISEDNVEVVEAHRQRIPVVSRAEMLGELMRNRYGIAVAGSHGKTTATSLIASIFQVARLDPTYVIGGLLKSERSNARLGQSRYFVAEADESDASFLYLNPMAAVVTNIDRDHLGTYSHKFENLLDAFKEFVQRLPIDGLVVACIDDQGIRSIIDDLGRPILTYGLAAEADYRAENITHKGPTCSFRVQRPNGLGSLDVEIQLPGVENVRNVLAAIAIASDEGIADDLIVRGLRDFGGIDRRFEIHAVEIDGCRSTLIDDYGHHPTEVLHVIETVRDIYPNRRLVMVYQPHRYTRTRDLLHEFVEVLVMVDSLVLVDTYAASEDPIPGAHGSDLAREVESTGKVPIAFASTAADATKIVRGLIEQDDVLAIQGAGNIDLVSEEFKETTACLQ
ncbi:MAG: UDP-N-acetylmuramate--L-alanine ligase [Gammaproteobacteria bacterium]|nr:UDP-N-acetylmuramate--L-alanine ligase [Gammaproteobacteria bacterium]